MHLAGKGRAILADEMGLGKTVQGIAAALLMKGAVGIKRALVVGRGVDKEKVARQIADTQGVSLPDEAIEAIDPDTWQLMKRLEKMGVIHFNTEFLQDVVVRTTSDTAKVMVH